LSLVALGNRPRCRVVAERRWRRGRCGVWRPAVGGVGRQPSLL